ncbi:MAG: ABC transporter substrate-binding protein [Candidatus Merdivicinus sp.]|jgi:putative aldouronate transport system substrate-binding protein
MRKSLKVIALLAAMAASMACFASCGNESSGEGNSNKTVNLSWIQISPQPNDLQDVTAAMNEYSKEKIGVTCDITYLDWGVWLERVKAMLQGGENFDIMFNNSDVYTSAIELGRFAELDELLNETPELKEFVPEVVWEGARYKGKIYAVPTYKDSSQTQYWVWDTDLVNKLGIPYEDIHTCADLDPWLYKIQDEIDAGNITQVKYAFYNIRDGINGQFMNYDASPAGTHIGVRYDDETATVVRIMEQPEMMEQYKYMYKWYNDGLINPDAPTVTEMPKWVPVYSGQGFPGAEVSWGVLSRGTEVVIEPWGGPVYSNGTIQGSLNSISSSSKNQKEALQYLQLVNTDPTMRNLLAYGIEGVHYTTNEDGTITRDTVKMNDYNPATYSQASFMTMAPTAPNAPDMYEKVAEWNNTAEESVLMGFNFDRAPVENQIAACGTVAQKYDYNIYTGAVNPEEAIPQMYAEMETAGLKDIEAELQKQINEFLGK